MPWKLHGMGEPEVTDETLELPAQRTLTPNDQADFRMPAAEKSGGPDEIGEPLFRPEVAYGAEDSDAPGGSDTLERPEPGCVHPVRNDDEMPRTDAAVLPHPGGSGLG